MKDKEIAKKIANKHKFMILNEQNSRNSFMELAKKEAEHSSHGSHEDEPQKQEDDEALIYRQYLASVRNVINLHSSKL